MRPIDRFWPHDFPVAACLGLISDTHVPHHDLTLTPVLFDVLDGVDLILHAGDGGELDVMAELSRIAPVTAVAGNHESPQSAAALPLQQIIHIAGQRLLLWHSHYPDHEEEMAARRSNAWLPKLNRSAAQAKAAGATVAVLGHYHVPFATWHQGTLLINPGAIAAPSPLRRQAYQTAALLFVGEDGRFLPIHFDIHQPDRLHRPQVDFSADFRETARLYTPSIMGPQVQALGDAVLREMYQLAPGPFEAAAMRVSRRVWAGEQAMVTLADLAAEVEKAPDVPAALKAKVREILEREASGE